MVKDLKGQIHAQMRLKTTDWRTGLLALGPFMIVSIFSLYAWLMQFAFGEPAIPHGIIPILTITLVAGVILGILAVLGISAARGFPPWTLPYWGLALIIFFYLMRFSGTIAGFDFSGSWLVWLPAGAIAAAGLYLGRRATPLRKLAHEVWQDWTRISFTFYGIIPALMVAAYDEVHGQAGFLNAGMLLLAAGALAYMNSSRTWQRGLALVTGLGLGWGLAAWNIAGYWGGRQEPWMDRPGDFGESLLGMVRYGVVLMVALIAPALLGGMIALVSSLRKPRPA